jgi:hypothetical protein
VPFQRFNSLPGVAKSLAPALANLLHSALDRPQAAP